MAKSKRHGVGSVEDSESDGEIDDKAPKTRKLNPKDPKDKESYDEFRERGLSAYAALRSKGKIIDGLCASAQPDGTLPRFIAKVQPKSGDIYLESQIKKWFTDYCKNRTTLRKPRKMTKKLKNGEKRAYIRPPKAEITEGTMTSIPIF